MARKAGTMRALVFFNQYGFGLDGVESSNGGLTSLNPNYPLLVEAISAVSAWRSRASASQTWKQEIDIVTRSTNPYLKYLGARFLVSRAPDAARAIEPLSRAPRYDVYSPAAPCQRPSEVPASYIPEGL
jgi:hypothetical protein